MNFGRAFSESPAIRNGDARQKGGSGLGLNIAQQIVSQHAGTITFENAPDGGAVFCLEIPLLNKQAGEMVERERQSA
jgi:signal transduction histidine kinase